MRKRIYIWLVACLLCLLSACAQITDQSLTWQEQYDLGVRYLSEGNYEEAIIAFTAAIEIDPKQAPAYVSRGNAYVLSGKTEENLAAAQADYEKATELDDTNVEAYLGLADVYIRQKDFDEALKILRIGLEKTEDQKLSDMIEGIQKNNKENYDIERTYNEDGSYWTREQLENGNFIEKCTYPDGTYYLQEYGFKGRKIIRTESNHNSSKELEMDEFLYTAGSKEVRISRHDANISVTDLQYTMESEDNYVCYSGGGNYHGVDTWTIRIKEVNDNYGFINEKEFIFDKSGGLLE